MKKIIIITIITLLCNLLSYSQYMVIRKTDGSVVTVSISEIDSITFIEQLLCSADAGSDVAICNGSSTNLTASGGVTYLWNTSATLTNITVSPTITTTYTVTINDGNGCTDSDEVVVTVNSIPTANAGLDVAICSGVSTNLTATGGVTYLWNTGETSATINVNTTSTKTYTVTVTNGNGCTAHDNVVVTVNASPAANAGSDVAICSGVSTNLTATGGGTYIWSTGGTSATINVSPISTTTYTVTVTSGSCTAHDNVIVTVNPLPTATINVNYGADTTLTAGGGVTYTWSTGTTLATITIHPTTNTTYTVTVTDNNGCTDSDSMVLLPINSAPSVPGTIVGLATVCSGVSGVTYSISPVSGATSYAWTVPTGDSIVSGQGDTSITVDFGTASGNICVTASNSYGTSNASCKAVSVIATPSQPGTITGPKYCPDDELSYSIVAVPGATSYTWTAVNASITGGQGTTSVTVYFGGTGSVSLHIIAYNGSCASIERTRTILPMNPLLCN